jgi:hypothetical protein
MKYGPHHFDAIGTQNGGSRKSNKSKKRLDYNSEIIWPGFFSAS